MRITSRKKNIREREEEGLKKFVLVSKFNDFELYDFYFWNYYIPQISKEFDLLRIGKNSIVNIELKEEAIEERIKKQLGQNNYYLKSLNRKVYTFCYVTNSKILYRYYYEGNVLQKIKFEDLKSILLNQQELIDKNIDSLFEPSQFLVSPFNKTAEFLNNEYFLTDQQVNIKKIF